MVFGADMRFLVLLQIRRCLCFVLFYWEGICIRSEELIFVFPMWALQGGVD